MHGDVQLASSGILCPENTPAYNQDELSHIHKPTQDNCHSYVQRTSGDSGFHQSTLDITTSSLVTLTPNTSLLSHNLPHFVPIVSRLSHNVKYGLTFKCPIVTSSSNTLKTQGIIAMSPNKMKIKFKQHKVNLPAPQKEELGHHKGGQIKTKPKTLKSTPDLQFHVRRRAMVVTQRTRLRWSQESSGFASCRTYRFSLRPPPIHAESLSSCMSHCPGFSNILRFLWQLRPYTKDSQGLSL